MTINEWVKKVFETAKSKGWHEKPNPYPEVLMKMVSELSESLEEYRNNKPPVYALLSREDLVHKYGDTKTEDMSVLEQYSFLKPEGMLIELADCVIRIMDTCGEKGWDLEKAIEIKSAYNETRSYKHGGKVC